MATPEMHYVDSTNVEAVGYDPDQREIHVQFHGGRTYIYSEADEATFDELRWAPTVGSHLNRVIKPNHPCRVA